MAFSGAQVTRLSLGGDSASPYGSFAGKAASPPVFSGTIPDISLTEGGASANYDLSTYFTGATSYSIAPAVEAGWSFSTVTALLAVDPTTIGSYGPYTVTGTNTGGSTPSNAFDVFVSAAVVASQEATGGWWNLYDLEMHRREREKKKRKQLEEEAEKLQDAIDRELVKELQAAERDAERVRELKRLAKLAEKHLESVSDAAGEKALAAAEAAIIKGNYSAMERFERELRKAKEEEEFLAMAISLLMEQ